MNKCWTLHKPMNSLSTCLLSFDLDDNLVKYCYVVHRSFLSVNTCIGYKQTLITLKVFKMPAYTQRYICRYNCYIYDDIEISFFEMLTPTRSS